MTYRLDLMRRGCLAGALCVAMLAVLAGCGGVDEGGTGRVEGLSVGVLKGLDDTSVSVNGVTYERSSAQVLDGFGQPLSAEDLRLGMWLEVFGEVDEAQGRGVAQSIRIRPAARGKVTAKDADGLTVDVIDTTVRLANGTVLDGVSSASEIAEGDLVEVHGPLAGGLGDIEASRIERLRPPPEAIKPFELRGRVGNLDPVARTATIGRRAVSYATANVALRSALANGQVVRVSSVLAPVDGVRWEVDRLATDQPLPANVGFLYTEGYVDGLQAGPLFDVEGLNVDARTASDRALVTANGQHVAVVGSLVDGTLRAKSIALILPGEPVVFTLSSAIGGYVSVSDFRVRGVAVDASSATFIAPATAAALANDVRVRVMGTFLGRRLIATRVEFLP